MSRDWEASTYARESLTDEQRLARAHRLAARRNPGKAAQHELAAQILEKQTNRGNPREGNRDEKIA